MSDCLFCKIVAGEIPASVVYEDEKILVFKDIAPKAPVHLLMIPKQHIAHMDEVDESNVDVISHMALKVKSIAVDNGLDTGYRIVANTRDGGGQEVAHLHWHILGDVRQSTWKVL
jgi:histidine triad (HIT) family protein